MLTSEKMAAWVLVENMASEITAEERSTRPSLQLPKQVLWHLKGRCWRCELRVSALCLTAEEVAPGRATKTVRRSLGYLMRFEL